jgi:adenylate/nucleoside-diphosphate kinase
LQRYAKYEQWIQGIRNKYFNMLRVIDLDATEHPETLLENLLARIDSLGLSIYRAPEFKVLQPPEGGFRALNESDIIRYWQTCHLEDSEPRRELSKWGRFCPVTFYEAETLTLGTLEECATYKVS